MQAVISHPDWTATDLSSLKMLNAGSMVVYDSQIRAIHARGVPVGQIYGCTETAPIATVLLNEDAVRKDSTLDEKLVLALFQDRLAKFKHPRRVAFLERLPRNAMGKVQKAGLKRLVDGS